MKSFKIATTQYIPIKISNWQDYALRCKALAAYVKSEGAQLLLLPEYAGFELASLCAGDTEKQFAFIQGLLPQYLKLFQDLAKEYGIYILAGTIPVQLANKKYVNRAHLFGPSARYGFQDKFYLTNGERETNLLQVGNKIKIFDTTLGKLAVAICYDSEFPTLVHQMSAAGANLILVPSCTASTQGFYRVHLSCRARALENQCYVANACLIGSIDWAEFIDVNVGSAGIFTPIDGAFPEDGILIQGKPNEKQVLVETIDYAKLKPIRDHGTVSNFKDMQDAVKRQPELMFVKL